jgi:hypothetical protein
VLQQKSGLSEGCELTATASETYTINNSVLLQARVGGQGAPVFWQLMGAAQLPAGRPGRHAAKRPPE